MKLNELELLAEVHLRELTKNVVREYKAIPNRDFRYDFCLTDYRILIECNGGTWTKGGHSSGKGIMRDYEKLRLAQLHGYYIFLFTSDEIKNGYMKEFVNDFMTVKEANNERT